MQELLVRPEVAPENEQEKSPTGRISSFLSGDRWLDLGEYIDFSQPREVFKEIADEIRSGDFEKVPALRIADFFTLLIQKCGELRYDTVIAMAELGEALFFENSESMHLQIARDKIYEWMGYSVSWEGMERYITKFLEDTSVDSRVVTDLFRHAMRYSFAMDSFSSGNESYGQNLIALGKAIQLANEANRFELGMELEALLRDLLLQVNEAGKSGIIEDYPQSVFGEGVYDFLAMREKAGAAITVYPNDPLYLTAFLVGQMEIALRVEDRAEKRGISQSARNKPVRMQDGRYAWLDNDGEVKPLAEGSLRMPGLTGTLTNEEMLQYAAVSSEQYSAVVTREFRMRRDFSDYSVPMAVAFSNLLKDISAEDFGRMKEYMQAYGSDACMLAVVFQRDGFSFEKMDRLLPHAEGLQHVYTSLSILREDLHATESEFADDVYDKVAKPIIDRVLQGENLDITDSYVQILAKMNRLLTENKEGYDVRQLEKTRETMHLGGAIPEETMQKMREVAQANWLGEGELGKAVLESFESALLNPSNTFYILESEGEVLSYYRLQETENGLYFGSVNTNPAAKGGQLAKAFLKASFEEHAGAERVEADASLTAPFTATYLEDLGFVATALHDYSGSGDVSVHLARDTTAHYGDITRDQLTGPNNDLLRVAQSAIESGKVITGITYSKTGVEITTAERM